MFLLVSGRPVRLVPIRISRIWKITVTLDRGEASGYLPRLISQILNLIYQTVLTF